MRRRGCAEDAGALESRGVLGSRGAPRAPTISPRNVRAPFPAWGDGLRAAPSPGFPMAGPAGPCSPLTLIPDSRGALGGRPIDQDGAGGGAYTERQKLERRGPGAKS